MVAGSLTLILAGFCLGNGRGDVDSLTLAVLGVLVVVSELAALPVPGRGTLSNGFAWLYTLSQVGTVGSAALVGLGALALRSLVAERGNAWERAAGVISDGLPYFAALAILEAGRSGESWGFPAGSGASLGSLVGFLVVGYYSLKFCYPQGAYAGLHTEEAYQARLLQFRISAMLAPATTLLAAGNLWHALWISPVMLGMHQFSWDRLSDLRELRGRARSIKKRLSDTSLQVRAKDASLSQTNQQKRLVEQCLRDFSHSASMKDTAKAVFRIGNERVRLKLVGVFIKSKASLRPLVFLDGEGGEVTFTSENFSDRPYIQDCWKNKVPLANARGDAWVLPMHNFGVLYFRSGQSTLSEKDKESLALLADQAAFGFRSAWLLENLSESLDAEKMARADVEQSRLRLEESQAYLVQSSKMAAVGQLAAGMAHELNTPLAAILLGLQAGKRSLKKQNLEATEVRIEEAEGATRRAKVIVDQLLTYSRKSDSEVQVASIEDIVRETVDFLAPQIQREGVEILFAMEATHQTKVNAGEVSQILSNLLLNARDALLETSKRTIRVHTYDKGETVVMEVQDEGNGVPMEIRDRIFEPFFTRKSVGRGTGLGLFISRTLAERQNGQLELDDSSTAGALFRLSLPAVVS